MVFPPRYDADYLPPADSRYWFPRRETMPAGERESAILERLRQVTRYAFDTSPFYRRKWDEAGFHPDHLRSLEDFESKVPVITKQDLREAQTRAPPFGDYLCVDERDVHHIHGTSGTTGRPTVFAIGRDDWDAIANAHARIMWGMGIRPGDIVFVAAIFSLYMGSWGALAGAERLRAKAFPFGAGAPGMTARAAMWLDIMKPAALYATPSFALHLAEVARAEGYDPREFGLKTMFFSGEPGASVPRRARPHRRRLRRARHRLRLDGGNDAVHARRGHGGDRRHAVLAGHRLHRGVRSANVSPRAVRSSAARRSTRISSARRSR